MKINNLETDLEDGVILINLLEQISSKKIGIVNKKAKIRAQKLENTGAALHFLKSEGIKLVGIGPEGEFKFMMPSLMTHIFVKALLALSLVYID